MSQDMDPGLGGGSYLGVQTWEMPQKQPTSVAEMMIHQLISGDLIFRPICIYIYTHTYTYLHIIYTDMCWFIMGMYCTDSWDIWMCIPAVTTGRSTRSTWIVFLLNICAILIHIIHISTILLCMGLGLVTVSPCGSSRTFIGLARGASSLFITGL